MAVSLVIKPEATKYKSKKIKDLKTGTTPKYPHRIKQQTTMSSNQNQLLMKNNTRHREIIA